MLEAIVSWWKKRKEARREAVMFERQVRLEWDETSVSASFPTGDRESIAWAAVNCVAIETNDSGPWGADVWWLLEGNDCRVAYPQGATGDKEMLEELPRRFPEFNYEAMIRAMGCTDSARFVCWQRTNGR